MSPDHDFHLHSTASDGTLSPSELMARAAQAGIRTLALTDHDTTEGVAEAAGAALRLGLRFLPGVEISVSWGGMTVHVVGLGVDPRNSALQQGLAGLRSYRDWRAEEIGRRLAKDGIPETFERAKALSNGRLISRTHFARALVELGHAESVRDVFRRYLVRGRPGHVPGQWAALGDAVEWIARAGGCAVVAHPARYPLNRGQLRRLGQEFRAAGGVGLEVVSGSHSADDNRLMAIHAQGLGLLASVGSDYHGPGQSYLDLGRLPPLPPGCTPLWQGEALAA
jgi:predicted metal-dependent phosphoesterase TrpH